MKRMISIVTILSLCFSMFGMPAMAFAEEDSSILPVMDMIQKSATDEPQESGEGSELLPLNQGALQVSANPVAASNKQARGGTIALTLTTQISHDMGANLEAHYEWKYGEYGNFTSPPVPLEKKDTATGALDEYYAHIGDVEAGEITLVVSGDGYQTFEQSIQMNDGDRIVVDLIDSTINERTYFETMGMGLIPFGDYKIDGETSDGAVTSEDADFLADKMAEHANGAPLTEEEEALFNLDGQNGIDLADVQILAMNISRENAARTRQTKDPLQMAPTLSDGSLVEGSRFEDVFIDNGTVTQIVPADTESDISTANPVQFEVTPPTNVEMGGMSIKVPTDSDGRPTEGEIIVATDDGEQIIPFKDPTVTTRNIVRYSTRMAMKSSSLRKAPTANAAAAMESAVYKPESGVITISFGAQIAVKKVTIKITATSSNKLAEIAQVEFLNGMEDKIPEPDLNIPTNIVATPGDKQFTVTWKKEVNITGYQVEISNGSAKNVYSTTTEELLVDQFDTKKLVNGKAYNIRIRSCSDTDGWYSPWSNPISVTPIANGVPETPDNVTITPGYTDMVVSWKEAVDAETYNIYWRSEDDPEGQYPNVIRNISGLRHVISDLESGKTYYVSLSASNQNGESPRSPEYYGTIKTSTVKVPWYNLINRAVQSKATGQVFDNAIKSVSYTAANDANKNPDFVSNSVVDGDYGTYWYSPRMGSYAEGAIVEFDNSYYMDRFAITSYLGNGYMNEVLSWNIKVWSDENPSGYAYSTPIESYLNTGEIRTTTIPGADNTYLVKFPAQHVFKIQIGYMRGFSGYKDVTISELSFYERPSFVDEVEGLWADDLHTILNDHVDQAMIDRLRAEVSAVDEKTKHDKNLEGEYYPDKDRLLRELDNAETVLNHGKLREPVRIDSSLDKTINNYAGGTNAWQPLGISVKKGDKINVFIGANHGDATAGANTALKLLVCQQHPKSSAPVATLVPTLKTGLNEIDINDSLTSEAVEDGGALYVEYLSSTNKNYVYSIRVEGGTEIPRLELNNVVDADARYQKCLDYVNALQSHVEGLEAYHNENHTDINDGAYGYGQKCTANMTDVGTNYMLFSVPASQVWNGLNGADNEEKARNLEKSLASCDETMILFYQHKGLSNLPKAQGDSRNYGNNGLPKSRQNVRYTQMFSGAFMYAAGNHIGVQWGSTTAFLIPGVTADENGKKISGRYFGWGLNHEIGHEINQGQYAIAEVTNNYYAQLSQSDDTEATVRWKNYETLYKRVTSGVKGSPAGGTGIGVYWQLHLAYDGFDYLAKTGKPSYNFKTYDNYTDIFNNLFFARTDSYARNPALAPKPGGVALSLNGNVDNNLIRLSCAAAEKDLRSYFIAWGLTPDATTDAYASQFPQEERALQYISEEARSYQMENYGSKTDVAPNAVASVDAQHINGSNKVMITWSGGPSSNDMWGYEILRNGKACGFVRADTNIQSYTDTINTVNNRVYTYQVKVVDKWMNRSVATNASAIKVHHENNLVKDTWTVSSDLRESAQDGVFTEDEMENSLDWTTIHGGSASSSISGCGGVAPQERLGISKTIDGDTSTVFNGSVEQGDASVTINFGSTLELSAVRYIAGANATNPITDYRIEISPDNVNWQTLRNGTFALQDGQDIVFFDNGDSADRLLIYDAAYMRITAVGQSTVSIAEIDVLGPTGDDLEIRENGIGLIEHDTVVGKKADGVTDEVIPAGSFAVTGTYQGNPAYNVVVLYDNDKLRIDSERPQNDAIIEGSQIIFAPNPKEGELLPDVREGNWVYYVTPEEMQKVGWTIPKNVSAELYRVDDAITMEGQRQSAGTLASAVPGDLPWIKLEFGTVAQASLLSDIGIQEAAQSVAEQFGIEGASQNADQNAGQIPAPQSGETQALPDDTQGVLPKGDDEEQDQGQLGQKK